MSTLTTRVATSSRDALEAPVVRKVAWRLMPLIMVCYFFAFFDRINISFAKFPLQKDLALSSTAYGLGASLFVVGYVVFEVPSASRRLTGDGGLAQATVRLATIHLSNLNIDLLEHEAPSGDPGRPGQNRAGTMHLCFEVDDLDAVFDRMAAAGLEWNGGQERFEADHRSDEGLLTSIAYFEDPDGTLLGLIHPIGTFRRFRGSFVV